MTSVTILKCHVLLFNLPQKIFNIKPDITTLGKALGNGFPISAVGGKKEIMNQLAPGGKVYQASTFAGNPVSVAAGIASIKTT